MNIKDIHYEPFSLFLLTEKLHDITRYMQVASEFGETDEGKKPYPDGNGKERCKFHLIKLFRNAIGLPIAFKRWYGWSRKY